MASRTYIAFLEAAPEGGYGVTFPDLPGCVSVGDDLDEAVANAEEALSLHLEGMAEDGDPLPVARSLAEVAQGGDLPEGPFVYSAITTEVEDDKERVNVYLPKSLLSQIDRYGQRTGIDNRSTFFRLAARRMLHADAGAETGATVKVAERGTPKLASLFSRRKETSMSDAKSKTGGQDRKRISLNEDYEVRDWSQKFGVSEDRLRAAVEKVGDTAEAVEKELRG